MEEEREQVAETLRVAWDEGGIDPLLSPLSAMRQARLQLEADTRLLIAYARRFTHPRPYKLIDLAQARRHVDLRRPDRSRRRRIEQVAEALGHPPVQPTASDG